MQQTSSSRKSPYTIKSLLFLFVFSALFFLGLWGLNSYVKIQKIIIQGYAGMVPLHGLSSYYKKNLFFVSEKDLEKSLLMENPQIRSVLIQKNFPDSLILTVESQSIIAELEMSEGYAYLSADGKIVQKARDQKGVFPLIRYYQKLNYSIYGSGDDIKYIDILTSLHFLKKLGELGLRTDTVDITGLDMLLFSIGDKNVLFTTEKNKETQDYELEQIIRQFKIEGKDFKSLDLRYEKPIIRF